MLIVLSRKPLALASPSKEFALNRATLASSQAHLVLFLLTKPAREPHHGLLDTFSVPARLEVITALLTFLTRLLLLERNHFNFKRRYLFAYDFDMP